MSSQFRIMTVSHWLYVLTSAVLLFGPLLMIAVIAQSWNAPDLYRHGITNLPPETMMTLSKSAFLSVLFCTGIAPMLCALWQMRGLFAQYRNGRILTEMSAAHILRTRQWQMAAAAVALILQPLRGLALTYDNPPGQRIVSVEVNSQMLGVMLVAGLLTVIGWALRDAARIADENASFV